MTGKEYDDKIINAYKNIISDIREKKSIKQIEEEFNELVLLARDMVEHWELLKNHNFFKHNIISEIYDIKESVISALECLDTLGRYK